MNDWLTIRDLSHYLQISENKIRYFIKHGQIPFYEKHGLLRFNKEEIDEWIKKPAARETDELEDQKRPYIYRGKPITEYSLTAYKVLIGKKPWNRLSEFVRNFIDRINNIKVQEGRGFLYRKEFSIFSNNYSDYLNVCFQLGLIEKRSVTGKEKQYHPTTYAEKLAEADSNGQIKEIILDSILNIVKGKSETSPDERHSVFLLWYILALKAKGLQPKENYFRKDAGELSYYPSIRFNFAKSLCEFLFDDDRNKEREFLSRWIGLLDKKRPGKKDAGPTLFDE